MTWFGVANRAFVTTQVVTPVLPIRYQYQNGSVNAVDFPNDFSFNISENFGYTTNPAPGSTQSLLVTQTGAGGGYQPATDFNHTPYGIDLSGYTGFTLSIRVQSAGPFQVFCHDINDVNIAAAINDLTEITALPLNTWVTLTFPMAYIGCWGKKNYYKHCIRSNRGTSGDILQLDNVGFVPGVSGFIETGNGALELGWADASTNATSNYAFDPRTLNAGTSPAFTDGLYALSGSVPPPPYPQSIPVPSKPMLALSVTSTGGKWRANFAGGYAIAPYTHFSFGAIPTKSGHAYLVQLYNTSGTAIGNAVDPSPYCPEDPGISTSNFAIYAVPLSAFGVSGPIGGISIQDNSGQTTNTIYISNVGFFSLPSMTTKGFVPQATFTVTAASTFGHSKVMTVATTGSFPTHANFNPGSFSWLGNQYKCYLAKSFEDGVYNNNGLFWNTGGAQWDVVTGTTVAPPTNLTKCARQRGVTSRQGELQMAPTTNPTDLYVGYKFRLGPTFNGKHWRSWGSADSLYFATNGTSAGGSDLTGSNNEAQDVFSSPQSFTSGWNHVEFYNKLSGSVQVQTMLNTKDQWNRTGSTWTPGNLSGHTLDLGNLLEVGDTGYWADYFVDFSNYVFYLHDASTLSASTKREFQVPVGTLSTSSWDLALNLGEFTSLSGLYLSGYDHVTKTQTLIGRFL